MEPIIQLNERPAPKLLGAARRRRVVLSVGIAALLSTFAQPEAQALRFQRLNGRWDLTTVNWDLSGKDGTPDRRWVDGSSASFAWNPTGDNVGIIEVIDTRTVS